MNKTVVALYDDISSAQQALDKLVASGFARDQISLMANDVSKRYGKYVTTSGRVVPSDDAVTAGDGAGFGATIGALTGIVAGLAAFVIPGVGPVIGAGPLLAGIGGLTGGVIGGVVGSATGSLVAGLVKTGITPEDASYYAEGIRRGGTLVVVQTDEINVQRARDILNHYVPVDIEERGAAWHAGGWRGYDANAEPYSPEQVAKFRTTKYERKNADYRRQVYDVPEEVPHR